ncbi:MAG: hypothetical protein ABIT37_08885 [Luteolibacter sp.]
MNLKNAAPKKRQPAFKSWPFEHKEVRIAIEVRIIRRHADEIKALRQNLQASLNGHIFNWCICANMTADGGSTTHRGKICRMRYFETYAMSQENMSGRPLALFQFVLEPYEFNLLEKVAKQLATTPEAVVRAALSDRLSQLREFLRDHPEAA